MFSSLVRTTVLDKFAISTSVICAVHCLCLPLIVGVFPALGVSFLGQEAFHQTLLWFVIPLSLLSLTLGCSKHKSRFVMTVGLAGLSVLTITAIWGHDLGGEPAERTGTLIGAALIAVAHSKNFLLCRQDQCDH